MNSKGFTIIELVVSIFVLSIAVIGIFNALSVVMILTSDSSDRLTATYLSQEGMEIVRNIRDTNWLDMNACAIAPSNTCPASWVDGLTLSGLNQAIDCMSNSGTNSCRADYTSTAMLRTSNSNSDYLHLNDKGLYVYPTTDDNLPQTKFKRRIIIEPIKDIDDNPTPHILKVKVQTSWDKKSTILSPGVLAIKCCPDDGADNCPFNVSNCITTEGTLYNWYPVLGSAKYFTTFNFGYTATGETDEKDENVNPHRINVNIPPSSNYGVDVHDLTAVFSTTGNLVTVDGYPQTSGDVGIDSHQQHDFSSPVTYTITAADGTTQDCIITVTTISP